MEKVFIALGTNQGDMYGNLAEARERLHRLEDLTVLKESSILETEPVDYLDQPDFLNQMVEAETSMEPGKLLMVLLSVEIEMGRKRGVPKGPRIIDLDIILFGSRTMESGILVVPHPRRLERDFIIKHLVELNPELKDPVTGKLFQEYL